MSTAIIYAQIESLPEGRKKMVLEFAAFLIAKTKAENNEKPKPASGFGCMKGMIKMADDFDEPLEDFKDYM